MASGTWSPTEKPVRAGFYNRFIAAALASIQPGARGILAIPVKANWGAAKEVVEITSEKELIDTYGTDQSADFTAYECIRLALLGGIKTVLGYRLADGLAALASITLKDSAAANILKLDTKYPTTRDFKVTIRDNVVDNTKQEAVLYEGVNQLRTFVFAKGATVVDNAIAAINGDADNVWITAVKVATGNGTIANVASQALVGGNAGASGITNADYVDAMSTFETRVFNSFALDGATEASLQTSVVAWVNRLRNEGKKIIAYLGGTVNDDLNIATGNARSYGFNHEGIVNVAVSGMLDGKWYPSSKIACFVAGKGTGQGLKESLTYATTPFSDVKPRLTNNQIISAIKAGTIVLVHDGEKVIIEKGINTLTSLREGQNDVFKKVKLIRIMDAIDTDTSNAGHSNYIGKVLNNSDGQAALLSAIKNYFETLTPDLLDRDFTVEVDAELQKNAQSDEFFWKYNAKLIDSMERIYGTGYIR